MRKTSIIGILMVFLLTTTISSASTTQGEKTQTKLGYTTLDLEPTPIYGYVYHKGTDLPISGAKVKFLIFRFKTETTLKDGQYSGMAELFSSRKCIGIAWAKGYYPSIIHVSLNHGHINQVDFYL